MASIDFFILLKIDFLFIYKNSNKLVNNNNKINKY